MILAIFDLRPPRLPTGFKSSGLLVQEKKFKIDFTWWPSWISHRNVLAIFDLQVAPILPTKFPVNWPFVLGDVQNRFSRWQL